MTDADKLNLAELARQLIQATDALDKEISDHETLTEKLEAQIDEASRPVAKSMRQAGLSFVVVDGRVIQWINDDFAQVECGEEGFKILP